MSGHILCQVSSWISTGKTYTDQILLCKYSSINHQFKKQEFQLHFERKCKNVNFLIFLS